MKLVSTTNFFSATTASSTSACLTSLGEHAAGDWIFVCAAQDGGGTALALYSNTFTVTIASPAVVTYTGTDEFVEGAAIYFTTTGALPTGLAVNTTYYVKNLVAGSNTFEVAATPGGAAINTSGTQSGVHTVYAGAYGWAAIGTQGAITGTRGAVFHKKAASASETVPTFSGETEEWTGTVIVIRGLDATTAVAAWQRVDWTGVAAGHSNGGVTGSTLAASSNGGAAITYSGPTMALVFAESDTGPTLLGEIGALTEVVSQKTAGTVSHMIGYALLQGSGTVPDYVIRSYNSTEGGNIWTLLLTPADADDLIPFASADAEVIAYLGDFGSLHDQTITWSNITTRQSTLDGVATKSATITRSVASIGLGIVPFAYSTSWSCNVNLSTLPGAPTEAWVGEIGELATPVNVLGKVLGVQWLTTYANAAPAGDLGVGLYLEDGSGNWSWFSLRSKARIIPNATQVTVIDPATGTREDGSGTLDLTTLKYFGLAAHRLTGSTAARAVAAQMLVAVGVTTLVGGGTSDPTGWQAMASCLSSWGGVDIGKRHSGASDQFQIKTDMAIGDGTHSVIANFSATSCAYPGAWNPDSADMAYWNCGIGSRTVELVGGDASSVNLGACLMSTDSAQGLNLSVSPSFSGTILTDGATFVGFDIAWDASQSLGSATIRSSPTAAIGGTTLNSTTIRAGTEDALATVSNGFTANNATFVAEGANYGLRVAAAGTLNINAGTTFSGFTKDIDITATTGTVTISLEAGVTEPTYQTAGAAVDVTAPSPTLDATVLANTRAVLYNRTADAEISNTLVAGTSWTHTVTSGASSGDVLDLYTFKEGYQESVATIIYTGADATFAVQQAVDDAIDYYRTAESITDYTTLTEFNFYAPDIYIQSDDPDGATSLKRMFIFYNGALTTEDGARYMRGGVTFRSAFDVVINRSVVPMAVDNVSATLGLYFTDESVIRVTTDDGTSWIAPPSAPGSIRYAFGVSPGQIETGVSGLTGPESAQLMAIPSASANAAAVAENPNILTVPAYLGLKGL